MQKDSFMKIVAGSSCKSLDIGSRQVVGRCNISCETGDEVDYRPTGTSVTITDKRSGSWTGTSSGTVHVPCLKKHTVKHNVKLCMCLV